MHEPDLQRLRDKLLAYKEELRGRLESLIDETARNLADEGGVSSETEFQGYEEELALGDNERSLWKEVQDALQRIESGTYGLCEGCRAEIPLDRLEALPYAAYCIGCARHSAVS